MEYTIKENQATWTVSCKQGKIELSYNLPKDALPTIDDVKCYIERHNLFGGAK